MLFRRLTKEYFLGKFLLKFFGETFSFWASGGEIEGVPDLWAFEESKLRWRGDFEVSFLGGLRDLESSSLGVRG